jgi:ribosome-binding factor A
MSIRTERVAGVIRETITEVLAWGRVKDPRVTAGGLITVTHVRVAADLGVAWVYVTTLGGEGVDETVAGLRAAAGYLRGEVGKRLHARRLPELRFEADTAGEQEARVEAAFREIEAERRAALPPDEVDAGGGEGDTAGEGGDEADPTEEGIPEAVPFEDTQPIDVPYPATLPETKPGGGRQ